MAVNYPHLSMEHQLTPRVGMANNDYRKTLMTIENFTLSLDMSKEWVNSSVDLIRIKKPSNMPLVNLGILWYHQYEDLIYSGIAGDPAAFIDADNSSLAFSLWTLKPDQNGSGTWSQIIGPHSPAWQGLEKPTRALTAQTADSGFIVNGQTYGNDKSIGISGMLQFDMHRNTISNISTAPAFSSPVSTWCH